MASNLSKVSRQPATLDGQAYLRTFHPAEYDAIAWLRQNAAGTPVIVSDVCAGREEIVDGETGLWFKSGDAGDLARALQVMQDDSVVRRMSNASYAAYWRDPPTLARHVARLEKAYRGMLAGAPQGIAESATGAAACVSP